MLNGGIEVDIHDAVVEDLYMDDGRVVVPVVTDVVPVPGAVGTVPARLDLAELVAAVKRSEVAIITLVPEKVEAISANLPTDI